MTSPDYSSIPDHAWELLTETPTERVWVHRLDEIRSVMKTEYLHSETLLAGNKFLRDETDGQKWGDMPRVAQIPMNVLYSKQHQIMEKMREGDRDHIRWWLNRSENEMFRTKRGRV